MNMSKKIAIAAAQFNAYVVAIREGRPTTGLLPAALSDLSITDSQQKELSAARKANRVAAKAHFKALNKLTASAAYGESTFKFARNGNVTRRFVATDKQAALKGIAAFLNGAGFSPLVTVKAGKAAKPALAAAAK